MNRASAAEHIRITIGREVNVGDRISGREILSLDRMRPHPALGPCRAATFSANTKSGRIEMTIFDNFCASLDI